MNPAILGPRGVEQRIEEIQDKMRSVLGAPATTSFQSVLSGTLKNASPSPLAGQIGGSDGPVDPTGPDTTVAPADQYKAMAAQAAVRNGIDPNVYVALINQESGFNPNAHSNKNAVGLAQLMPGTAAELGVTDRTDPEQSLDAGARYLSQMVGRYGNMHDALAAYNEGPGRFERAGKVASTPETRHYVRVITSNAKALSTSS